MLMESAGHVIIDLLYSFDLANSQDLLGKKIQGSLVKSQCVQIVLLLSTNSLQGSIM